MGGTQVTMDGKIAQFIQKQSIFFVASAPLNPGGHINLSPKGLDTFRILGPRTVAYLDLTGSGVETIAHLKENGRIVLMFCAFQETPNIVRLHGLGRVVEPQEPEFAALAANFPKFESTRSVIVIEVERISESCGFGVPRMTLEGDREQLLAWARKKGAKGLSEYRGNKNRISIDGLPGLQV